MISVVIVTYNSDACVGGCIDALTRCLPDAETIAVDNASTDSSRATAERRGARVIGLPKNIGFGRACNVGAERANNEHVLFLNPDVVLGAVDVEELTRLFEADELGPVAPAAKRSGYTFVEQPWASEALSLTLGPLLPRETPRHLVSIRLNRPLWASGAILLVRKEEFFNIGGFDSRYFLYYEDRDLSWRYREAGLPVRVTSAFAANHVGGGSTDLGDRRSSAAAFAMMGWLQYVHTAYGPAAATRAWKLACAMRTAATRSVNGLAAIGTSARVSRKSLQLHEVAQELDRIRDATGVLEQSDENAYWPDAVAVLSGAS